MAIKKTDDVYYFAIANAIRTKNGEETLYRPHEMATAIGAIPTGGSASGLPIEIDNETDMDAVLTNPDNVGKIYRYTGLTTGAYTNGGLYICYDDSEEVY